MEFPQHSQQLLSALRSQRQRGFLCDCTVQVGSSRFLAHRAVLASCSPFFHMFYSDSPAGSSTSSCVTLDNDIVTSAAFGLLLDFVYEGVLQLDESPPVEDILAAASFLHMNEVVRVCKRRLQRRGPLAEADSTRSEESGGLRKVPEAACGHPADPDLADTTQPGMDCPPLPPAGELVQSQTNISAFVPVSLTKMNLQRAPQMRTLQRPEDKTEAPLVAGRRSHPPGGARTGDNEEILKIKEEAIIISDEELEEEKEDIGEKESVMDVEEEYEEDIQEEELNSPHFVSTHSQGLLQINPHSNDYSFPLSPSSSSSGVGPSSQDTSSFASSLVPPSSSQQHPDPPGYFQELQDSMGNFVEDVPTCGVCGKTFSCTYTLRRHAIVHTRERPYECRYCYRSYTQSGDLYRHIRKAHDQTLPAKRSKGDTEGPLLPQPPPHLKKKGGNPLNVCLILMSLYVPD
uniref:Zinc finger and BTB domain containing 3 n=1 Tax=Poecilia latipinna TaxID=48699 RepID=A0A3B3V140_9TELE